MTGLFYTHATGAWLRLDSINWDAYEYSGFVDDFDLSPKTQEDFFNFRFDGYIYVQNSGAYQFRVTSSDGSTVMLNGELIIDNDEIHESVTVSSETINLSSGPQRITVDYFDYMGEEVLMVEYMGPDTNGEWVVIDAEKLKSTGEPGAGDLKLTVYPNPGSNGITQLLFEGGTGDPMIIRIMDAMGKQVREYFLTEDGVNHLTITDLDVESGVYIVVVNQYGNVVSERFVVIR